jgi:hypothetical protein
VEEHGSEQHETQTHDHNAQAANEWNKENPAPPRHPVPLLRESPCGDGPQREMGLEQTRDYVLHHVKNDVVGEVKIHPTPIKVGGGGTHEYQH